jgi:hypothetical protein
MPGARIAACAIRLELDVAGLQIAVHDRFFVRGFEPVGDLDRNGETFQQGDDALPGPIGGRIGYVGQKADLLKFVHDDAKDSLRPMRL